jgi:site-specific DNA-adenine methylase
MRKTEASREQKIKLRRLKESNSTTQSIDVEKRDKEKVLIKKDNNTWVLTTPEKAKNNKSK